jgi:hypothetical protein
MAAFLTFSRALARSCEKPQCFLRLTANSWANGAKNPANPSRLVKGQVLLREGAKDWHDLWDEDGFIVKRHETKPQTPALAPGFL